SKTGGRGVPPLGRRASPARDSGSQPLGDTQTGSSPYPRRAAHGVALRDRLSFTAMTWVAFDWVASQRPPASARLHSLTGGRVGMARGAQGAEVGWFVIITGAGVIDVGGGGPAQSAAVVSGTQYPGSPGVPVARQARSTVAPMPTQNRPPIYIRAALQGPPVV